MGREEVKKTPEPLTPSTSVLAAVLSGEGDMLVGQPKGRGLPKNKEGTADLSEDAMIFSDGSNHVFRLGSKHFSKIQAPKQVLNRGVADKNTKNREVIESESMDEITRLLVTVVPEMFAKAGVRLPQNRKTHVTYVGFVKNGEGNINPFLLNKPHPQQAIVQLGGICCYEAKFGKDQDLYKMATGNVVLFDGRRPPKLKYGYGGAVMALVRWEATP